MNRKNSTTGINNDHSSGSLIMCYWLRWWHVQSPLEASLTPKPLTTSPAFGLSVMLG